MPTRGPRIRDKVVQSLKATLEDLYNGKISKVAIIGNRMCSAFKCTGATSKIDMKTCMACHGRGIHVTMNQIGPGMGK